MKGFKHTLNLLIIVFLLFGAQIAHAQLLDPVKWTFSVKKISDSEAELILKAKIDPTWHLYSQNMPEDGPIPTTFKFNKSKDYILAGKTIEPNVKGEYDKVFEATLKYFANEAIFKQKVKVLTDKPAKVTGSLEFMACDDTKCLTPKEVEYSFSLSGYKPSEADKNAVTAVDTASISKCKPDCKDSAGAAITDTVKKAEAGKSDKEKTAFEDIKKNLWTLFIISFLTGLMAILTPCVFPMIPMTVTFFMKDKPKSRAKLEALFFGISIILIYTVIGTIVAVTLGVNFANFLSTHWIPNVLFFLIFLFFAASFLGMFEITLPSWIVNKSDEKAEKGGIMGPFFMAFTLVLVSFSCTGPLVGAILVEAAGGYVLEPIVGMLGFSLAFALPFTLFAFFPHWLKSMPKSGGWLNSVKVVLGFLELALGLKFLSIADQTYHWGILDREVYLAFWIVIFSLMGLYLLGKLKLSHDSDMKFVGVPRLTLAIITFTFVVYMIPGMFGAPLKALAGYLPPQAGHDFDLNEIVRKNAEFYGGGGGLKAEPSGLCDTPKYADRLHLPHGLQGYFDYEQGLACAKKQNKPVFIDFTGHGCVNCREMEANVWSHPEVLKRLKEDFVIIALYVDDKIELPEKDWITSKYDGKVKKSIGKKYADLQISRFNVNAQPYYVLLDTAGELLVKPKSYDLNVDNFIKFLDGGLEAFKGKSEKP